MIQIFETTVAVTNEYQEQTSYKALNASGKGKLIATINGIDPSEVQRHFNSDVVVRDGKTYILRGIIDLARSGKMGLSIAE